MLYNFRTLKDFYQRRMESSFDDALFMLMSAHWLDVEICDVDDSLFLSRLIFKDLEGMNRIRMNNKFMEHSRLAALEQHQPICF